MNVSRNAFSAHALKKPHIFFDVDIVVTKHTEMWLSVVCTLIDNDTRHDSGQNLLWTHKAQLSFKEEKKAFNVLW